jgi:hypothetical protein
MQRQRMHEKRQRRADDEIAHMNLFNDMSQLDEIQLRINACINQVSWKSRGTLRRSEEILAETGEYLMQNSPRFAIRMPILAKSMPIFRIFAKSMPKLANSTPIPLNICTKPPFITKSPRKLNDIFDPLRDLKDLFLLKESPHELQANRQTTPTTADPHWQADGHPPMKIDRLGAVVLHGALCPIVPLDKLAVLWRCRQRHRRQEDVN